MQKKILTVGMVIILLLNTILVSVVNAETIRTVMVYTEGQCPDLLKYNGIEVGVVRVSYYDGRVEQPAYCLERDMPGIGYEEGERDYYYVELQDNLTNTLIWRVITNSYPYVSLNELGVNTIVEAFVATKQAVYCILYGNDANNFERYTAIGEAGERTLNLLKKLVTDARNSNTSRPSRVINIIEESNKWEVDNLDNNYFSKTYSIDTLAEYNNFSVSINSSKLPEDTRIVNLNNETTKTFNTNEKFKILIPINHNIEEGNFTIEVTSKLKTYPVYYGKAPEGLQSYALAANPYESGSGSLNQTFSKNNSKITIIKKDGKTNEALRGTEFNILDSDKKIIYSNLITNAEGKIVLTGVKPGTYFLQEIKATEGYKKLERLIEFNMELNKQITLTVNNNKVEKTEYEENTEDITVNVEYKETDVNINNSEQNITENNQDYNINVSDSKDDSSIKNTDVNINIEDTDINKNTENTNTDVNITDTDVNKNTQNTNTNANIKDTDVNVNTQNTNNNVNITDTDVNKNTQNTNTNANIKDTDVNVNAQNTNTNVNITDTDINKNTQNTNTNANIKDTDVDKNVQSTSNNTSAQTKNSNTNSYNTASTVAASTVTKKLPKTGF